jgi:hypothetical protein
MDNPFTNRRRRKLSGSTGSGKPPRWLNLDSQALAALGAACVDHSTATAGLHANEKAVGAGAFDLGGLVSAFHDAQ